jgi:hypothetical protein
MKYEVATKPTGGAMSGTKNLACICIEKYKVGTYGIYCNRKIRGKNQFSVHAEGRAWDAKCTPENPNGDRLANDLWKNQKELGIQKIIWNKKEINCESHMWRDYTGANPHTNHLHIEMIREKAENLTKEQIWQYLK